jgi:hypothetical protein
LSEEIAVIDGEASEEIVPAKPAPLNLFGVDEPADVVAAASKVAAALNGVIEEKGLYQRIGQAKHVRVEGWTLLGSMLGVFPVVVWTHKIEDGWEARVEARTRSGEVVGAAEAECLRTERNWAGRDDFALRSMAQTRATSKALKQPLGFVVTLAGYNATPAEERDDASSAPAPAPSGTAVAGADSITQRQHRKMGVLLKKLEEKAPQAEGQLSWVAMVRERYHVESRNHMSKAQASDAIDWLEGQLKDAGIPF